MDKLRELLEAAGFTVFLFEAPAGLLVYPYVLLWGSPGQAGIEASVQAQSDLSDLVGVTMVHTSGRNVLVLVPLVRAVLDGAQFTEGGMLVTVALGPSQTVRADRELTLPDTNAHPMFAVDRYQVVATPA